MHDYTTMHIHTVLMRGENGIGFREDTLIPWHFAQPRGSVSSGRVHGQGGRHDTRGGGEGLLYTDMQLCAVYQISTQRLLVVTSQTLRVLWGSLCGHCVLVVHHSHKPLRHLARLTAHGRCPMATRALSLRLRIGSAWHSRDGNTMATRQCSLLLAVRHHRDLLRCLALA